MAILAKSTGGDFESCPVGMQPAVCCGVIDVGTHDIVYQTETKRQHQVVFLFELSAKITRGEHAGKPFVKSKKYTLSLHEKANLSKDLESWLSKKMKPEQRTEGIDLEKFVGMNCTLNLVESEYNGKTYININTILPAMPNTVVPVTYREIPQWIVDIKNQSIEHLAQTNSGFDDIPLPQEPNEEEKELPF